jgi:WD40 repeat protein
VTLRADFYDRPMRYPALGALMEAGGVSVLPMSYPELRAAVIGPAVLADVRLEFEDDLVGDLLFDVQGQAGALPLLQFTLDQLFERRDGRRLTGEAYQRIGGVRGALARHAEATYADLPSEEHRRLAWALFLRLADPGVTEQDTTRRRAAIAELLLPDPRQTALLRQVADTFIAARLLTTTSQSAFAIAGAATTMLEVSHEALFREWERLGRWLHEAREDIRRQHAMSADAAVWAQRGRPTDYLYRGSALLEAEAWAARNTPSTLELAFLTAARDERQRQADEQQQRQAAQLALAQQAADANRRAAHRLRLLAVTLSLFLGVAAILLTIAVTSALQARDAERRAINDRRIAAANARDAAAARVALTLRNVALSANLAAQATKQLNGQYDLALLLSVEAERVAHTADARSSLLDAVAHQPGLRIFLHGHTGPVRSVSFSPAGDLLASAGDDGTIRLWDAAGGTQRTPPLISHSGAVNAVAFSPDGTLLASGGADHAIRLWHRDPSTGQWRQLGGPLAQQIDQVLALAFSPDGRLLAASSWDGTIHLWDVRRRQPLGAHLTTSGMSNVAFSPDSRLLAAGSLDDRAVQLWDVASGHPLGAPLLGHTDTVNSVAFSPDGAILASAGDDRSIRLWDVQHQRPLGPPLTGHADRISSLAFSPDGRILASGSADQTIRLWDVAHRHLLGLPLTPHAGEVNDIAFNADGTEFAAAVADQAVLLWDTAPALSRGENRLSVRLADLGSPVRALAFTREGHTLVTGGDRGVSLWDVGQRRSLRPLLFVVGGDTQHSVFSPDGTTLAVWGAHHPIQLWTRARGGNTWNSLGPPLTALASTARSVAFSLDNTLLAVGGEDGTIRLWDVAHGRPRGPPLSDPSTRVPESTSQVIIVLTHPNSVTSLAFSPDGKILASGSLNGTVRLWDSPSGHPRGVLPQGHTAAVESVAFSPDSALIATGSADRTIRLWDVAVGQPLGGALIGHTGVVRSTVFSPDGSVLASGGDDGAIRLWSVAYRQQVGPPLTAQGGAITSLAFNSDGTTLAAGSADHTVRLWETSVASWAQQACQIAGRNLTRQEWQQYLGSTPYRTTCSRLPG